MCKNCTCVVDLIDIMLNSDTSDLEESNNSAEDDHSHRLFDNVDKDNLEKLKETIIKGKG